ncbi:transcription factor bHLH111 isoform X1 [Rhododendron vialii]|uniref:transcription factor bHLH111 isoform X1 n=1 Tax=Rhododendron vialii TaxID=182163 RepID=UPI00266051C5|nr:transcription factor bHLH111 isoform X1 [Rhododendron vialii]
MAGECTESSIATSSATPNWWPDLRTNSLSSWSSTTNPWHPHQNPNSNSSGEEDMSISNQSGLSVDSSRHLVDSSSANDFIGETASDSQLWSHILIDVGSREELNNTQEVGGNSTNLFASKSLSTGMFEPAYSDYLKKMDNSWEFANSPSFNNFDQKHFNGFNHGVMESERLTKLSNLVSNWSIAPPDSAGILNHQFDLSHMKQTMSNPTPFGGILNRNLGSFSCYGHDSKVKYEHQIGLSNSFVGDNKYYYGTSEVPCNTSTRSFSDVMNFSSFLSKPSVGIHGSKSRPRSLPDCKKQPSISTTQTVTRSSIRGQGLSTEGKKKRSEENSETALKKPKHDSSTVSSSKMQVPKVKLTDKITALQQIVSPFGKTDTASVLGEAIGYIKFLQEQVQLLSNPYMKINTCKDPWGGLERKDRGDLVLFDLQSRGLCLVPISCTPHACRENTGSDYWTPTYRGCLYR